MIEGLIFAGELVVFGLLLWNVHRLDGKPPRTSLGLFDMTGTEAGKEGNIKPKVPHA